MGVYIKNMEMPKSCADCGIEQDGCWCGAMYGYKSTYYNDGCRREDCPLVSVPTPHGRLIDADAAYNQFLNLMDIQGAINPCQLGTILNDAPTIIESEDE